MNMRLPRGSIYYYTHVRQEIVVPGLNMDNAAVVLLFAGSGNTICNRIKRNGSTLIKFLGNDKIPGGSYHWNYWFSSSFIKQA